MTILFSDVKIQNNFELVCTGMVYLIDEVFYLSMRKEKPANPKKCGLLQFIVLEKLILQTLLMLYWFFLESI